MAQADVWVVGKDPGGTNGVLPIYNHLRKSGVSALFIATGKAKELFKDKADVFADSAEELLKEHGTPCMLITSMCSEGGVGRDLVPLLRGICPTVAVQDFWGARLWTDWKDLEFRPDYIMVNDLLVAGKIIKKAWPEYREERIIATGYPALDKYAAINVPAVAARVREALGLAADLPIVLVGGQAEPTGHMLGEVVTALNDLHNRDYYFVPRPHPRTKDNFASEMRPWQEALARFRGRLVHDWFGLTDTPSLLAAAAHRGVVISMYSTILVEAAALHGPNISVLYPDFGMKRFRSEVRDCDEFPLVELDCSAKAETPEDLWRALLHYFKGKLDLKSKQQEHFPLDGKNAERAANFIRSLL